MRDMKALVLCDSIERGKIWADASDFRGIPENLWPPDAKVDILFVAVTGEMVNFGTNQFNFVLVSPDGSDAIDTILGPTRRLYMQQLHNQIPVGGFVFDARKMTLAVRAASEKPDIGSVIGR